MNTTQAHSPALETTVVRPPDAPTPNAPGTRPAVGVATHSATVGASELVPLLRKRLQFLLLVFAAFHAAFLIVYLFYGGLADARRVLFVNDAVAVVVCLASAGLLWSRVRLTLRQLRAVEFVLFAVVATRLVLRGVVQFWLSDFMDRLNGWIAAGEGENARQMLNGFAYRQTAPAVLSVVAYAVIVPNTWRRCGVVVAAFTATPLVIWLAGCIDRRLPTDYWFPHGVNLAFLTLIQVAVLSVYGAYRIESSRQEAVEARRLGQYSLREKLGGGGMGEVYLADHVLLRRPCAIKLIRPDRAGDPAMLQRFEREVRATATLTHPNTVQVFDYGHTPDGTFYYVMEHLPGLTLAELVKRDGPLPPQRAVHFLRQLCGALGEAHTVGLIHRDIKPGNVIVCERGKVPDVAKLLDFGLVQSATESDDKLTQVGSILGTPAYMAPEQAAGEAIDGRTDIYSLGALAYFLLTGQPPFAGKTAVKLLAAHLHEAPEPPSKLRPDVPPELEAIVLRCLAKRPEDRFATVQELDRAVAAVSENRG